MKTILHIIRNKNNDFRYHVLKGVFLVGSKISSKNHPLAEVNIFKDSLIQSKKVKKEKDKYILKENIRVGILMAYNLFSDNLKIEIEDASNPIRLFRNMPTFRDIVNGEMISTDNEHFKRLNRYCLRIDSIWKFQLDYSFLEGNKDIEFSKSEKFVANLLLKHGFITEGYRHGDTKQKECDIVDESLNIQIEVTLAFKTTLKNHKKSPFYDTERIVSEFTDNSFIHPSESLIKKITNVYSSNYKKYLAVVLIGQPESSYTLFLRFLDKMSEKGLKESPFSGYIFICYDPIEDIIHIFSTEGQKQIDDIDCSNFQFIKKDEVKYDEMNDKDYYLIILRNIFDNRKQLSIFKRETILEYTKDMKLYK